VVFDTDDALDRVPKRISTIASAGPDGSLQFSAGNADVVTTTTPVLAADSGSGIQRRRAAQ
jgi:hypothetical protein